MSANAQQPGMAVAVDASSVPAEGAALRAPEVQVAPAIPASPIPPAIAAISPLRTWRLAGIGYLLMALGSVLVCLMPGLHLAPGFIEGALACISMMAVAAGAGLTTWAFVRPMLR
jgi:hypothetical protein